jgi:hypothetical protein
LRVAYTYEQNTPWYKKNPQMGTDERKITDKRR